jgi:hypothetical protein
MDAETHDAASPCEISMKTLLSDYAAMTELLGTLPFDEFAQGYGAMHDWFAVRPVPRAMPFAS